MSNVAVIGGGPAGMLAAIKAAQKGHAVTLIEQNEKLGKKLFLTGKGRCNLTNAGGRDDFFAHVVRNPRFLYSAYAAFTEEDIVQLLHAQNVPTKVERGRRVYPESDKSSDVLRALARLATASGVSVRLNCHVQDILTENGAVTGLRLEGANCAFDAVILATGGLSYPSTGSTGAGHAMLAALGHTLLPPRPSLIPLETEEDWPKTLAGLTLKNVKLTAFEGGKAAYSELGELLFAHFGVTGPLVLSASAYLEAPKGATLRLDLKPGLTEEQLDRRLLRDIEANRRVTVKNAFAGLLPHRLLPIVLEKAGIDGGLMAGELKKAKRQALCTCLKALPLTVRCARPIAEAVITRGGASVKEVNPKTMESKLVKGLYLAGEVLDVDALTGGYNLQIAWSTGALAGMSV